MRIDKTVTKVIAVNFTESWRAQVWNHVTEDLRNAMIDSLVMDAIRMADAVENVALMSTQDILAFRQSIINTLAAGVARPGRMKVAFKVES